MAARGIVITPPFEINGSYLSIKGPMAPESLRQYLLYWDRIEWPSNNVIELGQGDPDVDFLKRAGVLQRTRIHFGQFSGNPGFALQLAQEAAFKELSKSEPGCWSVAQASNILSLPEEGSEENRTVEVELYSAIPVPIPEVPFEDVLAFKAKRNDELMAFRSAMDSLYEGIISSADVPRAKVRAIENIERSVTDLNRVFSERWAQKLLSTVKVELNIPNVAGYAIGAAGLGSFFGFPPTIAAGIGAAAAALRLNFALSRKLVDLPDKLQDFAYLHRIEKELK